MKALALGVVFITLLISLPASAWAWGQSGHSIVAEIAHREMGDRARAVVDRLLGHASLASVASWADDVKFDDRPDTVPWHFVNIPLAQQKYDPMEDCNESKCIVAVLDRLKTDLLCAKGDDAKRDALRFAVHFVGDLTQPLHTVRDGNGGNNFSVKVNFCGLKEKPEQCHPSGQSVKFHALWDDTLIDETVFDWGNYVRRLYKFDGWLQSAEAKKPNVAGGTPADWANDTHTLAPVVWTQMLPADNVIERSYYDAALPILDRQLGIGGLRLARFLDEAYSSDTCSP